MKLFYKDDVAIIVFCAVYMFCGENKVCHFDKVLSLLIFIMFDT
jgi:hypothetical protein